MKTGLGRVFLWLAIWIVMSAARAAEPLPADNRQGDLEYQRQRDAEQRLRQQMEPSPNVQIPAAPTDDLANARLPEEQPCTVVDQLLLDVRPAEFTTRLIALKPFAAELKLQKGEKEANPRSLTRLTMLNVRQGDQLTLLARGEDANAALTCFQQLADERFGD